MSDITSEPNTAALDPQLVLDASYAVNNHLHDVGAFGILSSR